MNVDRKTARIGGVLYLIIVLGSIAGGILSEMYIQSHLVGEVVDPAGALMVPEGIYRLGFAIYLLVYASDLAAAVVLYALLRPVNKEIALLAAFFRFAEATILAINLLNHYNAFLLLGGGETLAAFQAEQTQVLASIFLDAQRSGYLIGQVFFGFHCLFLGYLFLQSGYFPRVLGILLIAASLGYLVESFTYFLLPNYDAIEASISWIVAAPAFLAELFLTYWLLFKGQDTERRYSQIPAAI